MILGVVSDTHNRISNIEKIINIFNSNNVDKVIQKGRYSRQEIIDQIDTSIKESKLKI